MIRVVPRLRVQEVDEHQAPLGDLQRVRHLAGLRSCHFLFQLIAWSHPMPSFIELDDGKIYLQESPIFAQPI